jgi:putative oxidoreductase
VYQPLSISIVRVVTGVILGIHGWYRLVTGGFAGFGEYLAGSGIPLGRPLALVITLTEIVASACLVTRQFVIPAACAHAVILACGIFMVHAPEGWFVVGGGRNGVEFSVLLLACLGAIVQAERERGKP